MTIQNDAEFNDNDENRVENWNNGNLKYRSSWVEGIFEETQCYENGVTKSQYWCDDHHEKAHRRDFHPNGNLRGDSWFEWGSLHNENGPANTVYYETGGLKSEEWRINDELHREYAPAEIDYDENHRILSQKWALDGEDKTKEIEQWLSDNGIGLPMSLDEKMAFKFRFLT